MKPKETGAGGGCTSAPVVEQATIAAAAAEDPAAFKETQRVRTTSMREKNQYDGKFAEVWTTSCGPSSGNLEIIIVDLASS